MSSTAAQGSRRQALELLAISAVSLFLELAMIRFVNSTVQIVAYFNNFLIISAFLGLGAGAALPLKRWSPFAAFPVIFPVVLLVMVKLDGFGFTASLNDMVVWTGSGGRDIPAPLAVLLVFGANLLFFIPLGARLGASLARFDDRLVGYGVDLLGSFLGVVALAAVSYLRLPPYVWFGTAALVILFLLDGARARLFAAPFLLLGVYFSTLPEAGQWSPYYKVTTRPYKKSPAPDAPHLGYMIRVDKLRIQDALDFGPELLASSLGTWIPYYELPFRFLSPKRVLILGGGSGNDAAVALQQRPERVDVVEIDPVLCEMGVTLHPERPYTDPRVRVINDDARAFLRRTHETWDLVVMNALDSHHQLPGLSTLRLESFIYTVEAFRDVKARLDPEGVFVVHLASTRPWMGERLFASLTEAFGREPRLYTTPGSPFGSVAFVYGPDRLIGSAPPGVTEVPAGPFQAARAATPLATDDWPHLYLRDRALPGIYLGVLGVLVLLAVGGFGVAARAANDTPAALHFFLLGAGFMLLETRSITKSALLFGSTWLVNAIVIAAILLVIFFGNLLTRWKTAVRFPKRVIYGCLFASLLLGYVTPLTPLLTLPMVPRVVLAGAWLALPIFFASLVFSSSFRTAEATAALFGANLLGVVIGGALEYGSMAYGLDYLYLVALGLYLGAFAADRNSRGNPVRSAAAAAAGAAA